MAYSNLAAFIAGAAGYGKNFQQYIDGVPSLTVRQGVATDLAQLCAEVAGYSGNTFPNLTALVSALSQTNEVQNILSQRSQSERNSARTEWAQLITDFNAIEVQEGYSAGSYGATTTLINLILAAGMPNDLGQWADKLTASQITNAATAVSNMTTRATAMTSRLQGLAFAPYLWFDSSSLLEMTGTGPSLVESWGNSAAGSQTVDMLGTSTAPYVNAGAVYFFGADEALVGSAAQFDFNRTAFSALIHAKTDASLANGKMAFNQWDTNGKRSWRVMPYDTAGTNGFSWGMSADGSSTTAQVHAEYTSGANPRNAYHTFGMTWNAGTMLLYLDGVLTASTKTGSYAGTTIYDGDAGLSIGAYLTSGVPAGLWKGWMKHAMTFNKVLTGPQMLSLHTLLAA